MILFTGGMPSPGGCLVLGGCLVPGGVAGPGRVAGPGGVPDGDPPRMATAAGGTHSTGMHCYGWNYPIG